MVKPWIVLQGTKVGLLSLRLRWVTWTIGDKGGEVAYPVNLVTWQ